MRRCIAGFLLCALVLHGSASAVARTEQTDSVVTVNGVAATTAVAIASEFVSNMSVLAAIVRPMSASGHGARVPYNLGPITPPKPISLAEMRKNFHPRSGAPTHESGIPLKGPAMLARPLLPTAAKKLRAPQNTTIPGATRRIQSLSRAAVRTTSAVNLSSTNLTGINAFWSYEEGAVTGIGKYMLNVGNGNLIMQADDVDIAERGIDLAFRRTYNSLSQYDWNQTDGSENPGQYGAGWTNSMDSHLANNSAGGLSVFDLDGARYDYTANGTGCYTPPPGQYASLCVAGGGYLWTKKSGTVYYFYTPAYAQGSPVHGYAGRLYRIYGRNNNNYIQFNYSWVNGDSSAADYLTQIVAQHSDGQALTLYFETSATNPTQNPTAQRLLTSIVRPDGVTIPYYYDSSGYLLYVMEPSNAAGSNPWQGYAYYASHLLQWAASPRWISNNWSAVGGYTNFAFNAASQLSQVAYCGAINPTPDDNTSTPVQNGSSLNVPLCLNDGVHPLSYWWSTTNFSYDPGTTYLRDADGHATNWWHDSTGRVTETDEYPNYSYALFTLQGWDSNNNLAWARDARGNQTDYAYDSNGDTIAVAAPAVNGFRPTTLLSYDNFFNVVSACDPVANHNAGRDWSGSGTPANCPSATGSTFYTYDYSDTSEPNGKLTDTHTPLGYHAHITYDSGPQGGDFGLPTSAIADSFTQTDGSTMSPAQYFSYNALGDLTQFQKSIGNGQLGTATMNYDGLNRLTMATDPDGYSLCTAYLPNGQVSASETPTQHALVGDGNQCNPSNLGQYAETHAYDSDGNEIADTRHFNNESSATTKWYDGSDRLVEVGMPWNSSDASNGRDFYSFRWLTRYIYDLSGGGTQTFAGQASFAPHGNLAKTQEYNCGGSQTYAGATPVSCAPQWNDLKGYAYDGLDRPATKYTNFGSSVQNNTSSYDASGQAGLLSQSCDALGECSQPSYDADGNQTAVTFVNALNPTPNRTYAYDANARVIGINSTQFGTQGYAYDADGRLTTSTEPSGGGVTSPATFTYSYYPNGMRSALSVGSSGLTQSNMFRYAYRNDGAMNAEYFAAPGEATTNLGFTRSDAGRVTGRSEDTAGSAAYSYAIAYDQYGRLSSQTMPSGQLNSLTYDAEGEKTGLSLVPSGQPYGPSYTYGYNIRGERLSSKNYAGVSANGFMVTTRTGISAAPQTTFNAFMAVMTNQLSNANTSGELPSNWNFDAAGRQNSGDQEYNWLGDTQDGTFTRSYDAENHIVGQVNNAMPMRSGTRTQAQTIALGYQWGPNGHPILIGSSAKGSTGPITYSTIHWDGDQPLFVTNADGQLEDVKIGTTADYTPLDPNFAGITFWDRDSSGTVIACHNRNGAGIFNSPDETHLSPALPCPGLTAPSNIVRQDVATSATVGHGGILFSAGTDGISDGYNTIQGVRSYDPQLGSWTTPDAYAGKTADPMSQKAYVWNRNNGVAYSDPSGYDTIYINYYKAVNLVFLRIHIVTYHTFITVKNDAGKIIKTYSFGPTNANGSGFLNKDYALNAAATLHPEKTVVVFHCVGTCAPEPGMAKFYANFKNNTVGYFLTGHVELTNTGNSNTGSSDTLAAGHIDPVTPPGAPGQVQGWDSVGNELGNEDSNITPTTSVQIVGGVPPPIPH